MISLQNVFRSYGKKTVIAGLSHSFPESGVVALMGPSGCGKTTLLRLLAGLDKPNDGTVQNTYPSVAAAFQEPRLIPWLTSKENINFVLSNDKQSSNIAHEWLEKLEIAEAADALPSTLSGGQKQRVSLARALAAGAELLLLDEPFAGLDEDLKKRIAPHIRNANQQGLTVLVTHDAADAALLGAAILRCHGAPLSALQPN